MTPLIADRPACLFIVDDETALMQALCSTLRMEGYETVGFTSARDALQALPGSHCDLLLADLMMPEMDGIALLREALQADPMRVGIIMTGEGSIASAVEAMKAGALDFVLKPFNLNAILPALSRGLALRRLHLTNADLEQRVRGRTLELEAANKELAAFTQSVSHDLRSPLHALGSLSEMLLRDFASQMPARAQQFLGVMNTGIKHMKELVDDLLRFSSVSHQPLQTQVVEMNPLVSDVLAELHLVQPERSIDIRVEALPPAQADPSLVRHVLVNLLSNAFKFTRRRDLATIEVGCTPEEGINAYFVRDNGAGFDMERADRLFGVFQRLHSNKDYEGTGVGLSIVQRIVERHGGRVWAEAAVGQGATFRFTLPAAKP
ncbi:MAG TPA: ATP-binding protein [Rhizobacter sp.]|nr:ATP-binding protein [Rhizobacter sp.]